jgi:hypothetical protein
MSNDEIVGLEVHLRGGASFEVDVTEFTFRMDRLSGKSLEWATPVDSKGRRRLVHLSMDEVAALVEVTR